MQKSLSGLYLVTPDWDDTKQLLTISEQALQGGAAILQYRHKTANPTLRLEQAQALLTLCRRYDCLFIINDHIDLCLQIDADGIHVGGTDASVSQVRAQVGAQKIVGASCYGSMALAQSAYEQGASYVAYGGFYPSRIKKYDVTTPLDIVTLSKQQIPLPTCVIGGMTQQNCLPFIAQKTDMVAAISSVYFADNPKAAAQQFCALFDTH